VPHCQCAIPVFEGLLPPDHNEIVLDLLFNLATWHAYAKLCIHTDDTLAFFDSVTVILGQSVHKFQHTICAYYHTTEIPNEYTAHGRPEATLASKQAGSANTLQRSNPNPKVKTLNIFTYKYHALADYPNTIQRVGTSDSYSTQPVSDIFVVLSILHLIFYRENLNIIDPSASTPTQARRKIQCYSVSPLKKLKNSSLRK
jgi:hypothetical protein